MNTDRKNKENRNGSLNDKKSTGRLSRRRFLQSSFTLAAGIAAGTQTAFGAPAFLTNLGRPDSNIAGVQIGVITYSYRSMDDQSAKGMLKAVTDSGIGAIELMGDPAEEFAGRPQNTIDRRAYFTLMRKAREDNLTSDEKRQWQNLQKRVQAWNQQVVEWRTTVSMDKFVELRQMYNDAGVEIYSWKPRAFGQQNTDEEIRYALKAARALGASACTAEHPGDDAQTARLGALAAEQEIFMSYHAHTQATPTLWDTALEQSDYNAINLDIGHWVAAGNPDSLPFVRKYHDRIESIHLKDRTTPEHGAENLMWGHGDTPIRELLQLMRDEGYGFPATVELEYEIPEGSNAVKEVSRCLDYCRDALTA